MAEEKTSKKGGCLKIGCGGFLAFLTLLLLGSIGSIFLDILEEEDIEKCNKGVVENCENLKDSENDLSDVITNPQYKEVFLEKKRAKEEELKIKAEKEAIAEAEKAEKEAKRAEEQEKQNILIGKRSICIEILKASLKDPSSFKEVNSILDQIRTGIIVYSATNSYGGRIQSTFDCNG